MNWWSIFPFVTGYERIDGRVRLYMDWPQPIASFDRQRGEHRPLFRLYAGQDAESIMAWLSQHKAWQVLRIAPPLTPERAAKAVLVASDWHSGEGSALFRLASTRVIADDAERERLQKEVRLLIHSVIENPVRDGELEQLQLLEDVVNAASVRVELCGAAEVVDAFFGTGG